MAEIVTLEQVAAEQDLGRRRNVALFIAGLLIGALVLGTFVWVGGAGFAPTTPPGEATVAMRNIAYSPDVLEVAKGTTVTWVNEDPVYHTATSDAPGGPLQSPNVDPGERWSFTFTEDGTYEYHCVPHSTFDSHGGGWMGMVGTIVVGSGQGGGGGGEPMELDHDLYDPATAPLAPGTREWNFTITARELPLAIAKDVPYAAWTFDGTIPGPVFRVRQGDRVNIELVNAGTMNHSIDFHSARINWATAYRDVVPGTRHTYSFAADYPGVYMYHCGSGPVLAHVANGMYGMMIVEPAVDTRPVPDKEYVLVLSEFYASDAVNSAGLYTGDIDKMLAVEPTRVAFNGYAFQYHPGMGGTPLTAGAGDRIRLYVLDAGPTLVQSFHVIGAIFDAVYIENNPENALYGIQTWTLPSSGGAAFDLVIPDAGLYPFVTHSFAYTGLGAVGVIAVT